MLASSPVHAMYSWKRKQSNQHSFQGRGTEPTGAIKGFFFKAPRQRTMVARWLLAAILLASGASVEAERKVVVVPGWPKIPIFSPAIISGGFVFVSGMVGFDLSSSPPAPCPGGAAAEAQCALANVGTVLRAAGTTLDHVVDCTVFLASMGDFDDVNAEWLKAWPVDPPARAAFQAGKLAGGAKVEIKCVAALP